MKLYKSCYTYEKQYNILSKNKKQKVKIFHKENRLPGQEYTVNRKMQQVTRNFSVFILFYFAVASISLMRFS